MTSWEKKKALSYIRQREKAQSFQLHPKRETGFIGREEEGEQWEALHSPDP